MSNRNYASGGKIYSMHVKPVIVDVKITIGALGAVTSFSGAMVQSVVRTSQGLYKIKLQNLTNFTKVYTTQGCMESPATGLSGIIAIEVQNAPSTSMKISSGGEISIKTIGAAAALSDPASGSVIDVLIIASDSGVLLPGE